MRKKIKKSNNISVLGNGLQKKPYMHVDTLIRIIDNLYMSKKMNKNNILNIGPDDDGITVKEIINKFVKIKKLKNKVFLFESKKRGWEGDVIKYRFDVSKIKKILSFKIPSSEKAVEKTIREISL
jgi:UDP-glucose 4-epimerase